MSLTLCKKLRNTFTVKRTIKEYYKILKRINGNEKFVAIPKTNWDFTLYEELREEGLISSSIDSRWNSGVMKESGDAVMYNFSPTIKGIQLQYQIRDTLFPYRFLTFFWGIVLSAVVSVITYSASRMVWHSRQPSETIPDSTGDFRRRLSRWMCLGSGLKLHNSLRSLALMRCDASVSYSFS